MGEWFAPCDPMPPCLMIYTFSVVILTAVTARREQSSRIHGNHSRNAVGMRPPGGYVSIFSIDMCLQGLCFLC